MKVINGKVLLRGDYSHNQTRKLGEVEIEISTDYNKRRLEGAPQKGTVVHTSDSCKGYDGEHFEVEVNPGDEVIVSWSELLDPSYQNGGYRKRNTILIEDEELHLVPYNECFLTLNEKGEVDKMLCDYVLLEPIEEIESSILFIPDSAKKKSEKLAKIIKVSKWAKENYPELIPGETAVLVDKYARYQLWIGEDRKEYYRAKASELIALV